MPNSLEHVQLRAMICDADDGTAEFLAQALRSRSKVLDAQVVNSLSEAQARIAANEFNTVFIDPMSIGLDESSSFVFGLRQTRPNIVFVLYVDKRLIEYNRATFYLRERSRFLHYYTLDKRTPAASFATEVKATVDRCTVYLRAERSEMMVEQLQVEAQRLAEADRSGPETELLARLTELKDLMAGIAQAKRSTAQPNSVFLSCRFAEKEFVTGLTDLLTKSGFDVVTGSSANTYIGRAILDRIATCEYFLCLMTRDQLKADGTYTTSPWLLEEKVPYWR